MKLQCTTCIVKTGRAGQKYDFSGFDGHERITENSKKKKKQQKKWELCQNRHFR